jgi:hypothetical protein
MTSLTESTIDKTDWTPSITDTSTCDATSIYADRNFTAITTNVAYLCKRLSYW